MAADGLVNQLDLRICPHELVSWWQHPLIMVAIGCLCLLCLWGIWAFVQRARRRARMNVWAQLETLLQTPMAGTFDGRDQMAMLSGVLKRALAHYVGAPQLLTFSDEQLIVFVHENERLGQQRTEIIDLIKQFRLKKFVAGEVEGDAALHARVCALIESFKGLSHT